MRPLPKPLFSIQTSSLLVENTGAVIEDFAISPDDKTVAVEFQVGFGDRSRRTWIGEWQLTDGKLVAKAEISDAVPTSAFSGFFRNTIQYLPDGTQVLVQIGNHIYFYNSSDLTYQHSIRISMSEESANSTSSWFVLSANSDLLFAISGQSIYPQKLGAATLYRARTGTELSRWPLPGLVDSIDLSADGGEALLTLNDTNPSHPDIVLLDSLTGRKLNSFQSGFQDRGGAVAYFIDANKIAIVQSNPNVKKHAEKDGITIRESRTGKLIEVLAYEKLAPSEQAWVSPYPKSTLAVLGFSRSWWKEHFTEGEATDAHLLFFDLERRSPFCLLGPLPETNQGKHKSGFLRLSHDLGVLGLFDGEVVTLYRTSDCLQ